MSAFWAVSGFRRGLSLVGLLGGAGRRRSPPTTELSLANPRGEGNAVPAHNEQPAEPPATQPPFEEVEAAAPTPEASAETPANDGPETTPELERILVSGLPSSRPVVLGIDIGGTGIKGAPVNVARGALTDERYRIPTPQPATPEAVAASVAEIVRHFAWSGPIGCTIPAVVKRGIVRTAANLDPRWIGTDGEALFERATGCRVVLVNDADAAGIAEMEYGAGTGEEGVVLMVTLGTGIGSALFVDRRLVPNTELGHLQIRGKDAERRAAESARERKGWSWRKWGAHVNEYLLALERLFSPDLIIVGGGVSRKWDKFFPYLTVSTRVEAAKLLNEAGIVGAARAATARVAPSSPSGELPTLEERAP